MDPILDSLNPKQREAVISADGAVLVLAGAGSGKTRVITHRFAYIMREKRMRLHNILAITFTNKAAGEMKERIGGLLGADTRNAWIRTFHSMGVMILRKNAEAIGYPKDFVIYDDTDTKNLIKTIMKDKGINIETYDPSAIAGKISSMKDDLESPAAFEMHKMSEFDDITAKVYHEYERLLRKNRAVDFPDLIAQPIRIFESNPHILSSYHDLWQYAMVDEFQDTNSAQYRMINLIAERNKNICIVGDDDQSIYGWRGANVENLYDFQVRYQAKVIPLEQNYRSTSIILNAANKIVEKIPNRMDKKLWTDRADGEKIKVVEALTDKEEAEYIVDGIKRLLVKYAYSDFAVFYRTNAQSRVLEEAFLSRNIPYKIFGGQKFYERKEIKDILCYIRLTVNPFDGASFNRIVNVPKRKIGDTSQERVSQYADSMNISYVEALLAADSIPGIQKTTVPVMKDLGQVLLELNQSMDRITPMNFVKILIEAIDYKTYITNFDVDGLDRWSNVEELINSIRDFENANPELFIADFLNEVTLQSSVDELGDENSRNYVSLMTIHNAKGLEYPVVYLCGVVDGLIPHAISTAAERDQNEERRLFYVAITRAKDLLTLLHSETRMKYGEIIHCNPSPFLKDIPEDYLELVVRKAYTPPVQKNFSNSYSGKGYSGGYKNKQPVNKTYKESNTSLDFLDAEEEVLPQGTRIESITDLKTGDTIVHKHFGKGKVTFVSPNFIKAEFGKFGTQMMSGNFISSIQVVKE